MNRLPEIEIPKTYAHRETIFGRIANLIVGSSTIHIPNREAPLRISSVDPDAFKRLQNLPEDANPSDVIADLNLVTGQDRINIESP